jgi:hypothetical protein
MSQYDPPSEPPDDTPLPAWGGTMILETCPNCNGDGCPECDNTGQQWVESFDE